MRIAFLLPKIQLAGGVYVVLEHAKRLVDRHGFDVAIIVTRDRDVQHRHGNLDGIRCIGIDDTASMSFDIAIATWWETVYSLPRVETGRHVQFIQSMEDRFYPPEELVSRRRAGAAQSFPISSITEARWIADQLHTLQPHTPLFYVRNGVDKEVFSLHAPAPTSSREPLRIVIEGAPDVWFKGVPDALAATNQMRERRHVTVVTGVSLPSDHLQTLADRVESRLTQHEMAQLLRESHVLLKLSRVEGMAGPPLEAFHMGATAVLTPVTGHDEYAVHGWNCQLVGFDDIPGTARTLDLLARDRRLLHYLRFNAVATARAWPSWAQSTSMFAAALQKIASAPPPAHAESIRQLILDTHAMLSAPRERSLSPGEEQSLQIGQKIRSISRHPLMAPLRPAARLIARRLLR